MSTRAATSTPASNPADPVPRASLLTRTRTTSQPFQSQQSPAATLFDLTRLLTRLDHNILSQDADPALAHSGPLRRKSGANIEFARTLVLKLERAGSAAGRTGEAQGHDLERRIEGARVLVKKLNRRLVELDSLDVPIDGTTRLGSGCEVGADNMDGQGGAGDGVSGAANAGDRTNAPVMSELRQRAGKQQAAQGKDDSVQSAREALFATATSTSISASTSHPTQSSSNREVVLEQNRQEQESLTTSLLDIAKQLKTSSRRFGSLLETDREVARRAEKGLDKNVSGLEAADRKMGMLRKMTEEKGWLGRMRLYAILGALWVAAFLVVFVGPKLRF